MFRIFTIIAVVWRFRLDAIILSAVRSRWANGWRHHRHHNPLMQKARGMLMGVREDYNTAMLENNVKLRA